MDAYVSVSYWLVYSRDLINISSYLVGFAHASAIILFRLLPIFWMYRSGGLWLIFIKWRFFFLSFYWRSRCPESLFLSEGREKKKKLESCDMFQDHDFPQLLPKLLSSPKTSCQLKLESLVYSANYHLCEWVRDFCMGVNTNCAEFEIC